MGGKRSKDFFRLLAGNVEYGEGSLELGCNFIELVGRYLEVVVGSLQAYGRTAGFCGGVFEGAACDIADPQSAHEFQARKPGQIVGVPLPKCRIPRFLAYDRILHERIAEMIDHRCDGKYTSEAFV